MKTHYMDGGDATKSVETKHQDDENNDGENAQSPDQAGDLNLGC